MHIAVSERHTQGLSRPGEYRLSWQLLERILADDKHFEVTPSSLAWSWSQTQLQQGKLDAVFFAAKTEERSKWAQFSPPLTVSRAGFYSLPGTPPKTIQQLKEAWQPVGVIEGSAQSQFLRDTGFNNFYGLVESDALLQMLQGGRLEHIFILQSLANHYCSLNAKEHQQPCLIAGEMPMETTIHLMGNLGDPAFANFSIAIAQGLKKLVASDEVRQLYEENGLPPDSYQKWLTQFNASPPVVQHRR